MNPEAAALARRARDIFLEAVAIEDNSARAAYVTSACAGMPALLAEVEALLKHDQPDGFLELGPARFGPAPGSGTVEAEQLGGVLGHYQLIEKLGEGGFGTVWAALQTAPVRRRVALKIIKLGMDTKQVVGRFEIERQALALMDHPSIAKVLDAGATERGRPYFVMELVPGIRITDYCEQNRLPTKARLGLFIQVCQAIQHAHQKGIIHRDIKPSNILVTQHDGLPLPKVIDFGIAKAMLAEFTEATVFTQSTQLIGTPAYMSPEQAAMTGLDVDTRSDIYSLGVLLYELLTGSTPFDTKELVQSGMERLRTIIREREPLRPSARLTHGRGKSLTGQHHALPEIDSDLDWIVMKCLEKDRARRYETANGLAADLMRYLAHEPVVARPPSAAYRFSKAWQRNRLVFAAGAAVFAALAVGLGLAIHGLLQARAERANADQARLVAQQHRRVAEEQERLAEENAQRATEAQKEARRALARAQIALADAAYQHHDGPAIKRLLAEVPEGLRDSSWNYLRDHADTSLARLKGFLVGAAPHPLRPGVFAVAEHGGGIALVDSATGQRLREIDLLPQQRAAQYARGLAVSPDGRQLAVGCLGRGGLALYDLEGDRPPIHWEGAETDRLEFSPDGRTLLQSSNINREVCLWDASSGRLLWRIPDAWRAVFHPSGAQVITTHGAALVVLAVTDGSLVRRVAPLRTGFLAIAVSPDGKLVVTGERDGYLRAVDLEDGRVVFERPAHNQLVRFVEFTADGSRFASVADEGGSRQSIQVWQASTGAHLQSILGGSSAAESLRIHPLSQHLLVTGPASRIWALQLEKPVRTYPGGTAMAFFGEEQSGLGAITGQGVQSIDFDPASPTPTWSKTGAGFWTVTASADGLVGAVSRSGTWSSQTTLLRRVAGVTKETCVVVSEMAVSFARLSPNGDRLVTFVPGGVCSGQFDTRTGESLAKLDTTGGIVEVHDAVWLNATQVVGVVTAGARRGAAGSEEWLVLWEADSGRRLQTCTCDSIIRCLAAAPDGRRFAEAGEDKMIRIREAASLGIQGEFRAHDSAVTSLAWSHARPVLASASADLTIKIWDQPTANCLAELRGPSAPAISLNFSPSGRRLISAGPDGVRLWAPAVLR